MKVKIGILAAFVSLFFLWQLSLPPAQYHFRAWESLISNSGISNNPFLPNQHLVLTELGDLAPYTDQSIPKTISWTTDQDGFRNETPLCESPEILIFGDSMAVGASLSDSDTLASQLKKDSGTCVRSLAGGRPNQPLGFLRELKLTPKTIFVVLAERNFGVVTEIIESDQPVTRPNFLSNSLAWVKKYSYWNFRRAHGMLQAIDRSFGSRERHLLSPAPSTSPRMLFFGEIDRSEGMNRADIQILLQQLNVFADQLKARGINLVFTLVPNKESIYPERAHREPPQFYERLKPELTNLRFRFIDLFQAYHHEKNTKNELLYQLDDTHWNAKGVSVLSQLYSDRSHK